MDNGGSLNWRVFNSLKRTDITSVTDVIKMLEQGCSTEGIMAHLSDKEALDKLEKKLKDQGYLK